MKYGFKTRLFATFLTVAFSVLSSATLSPSVAHAGFFSSILSFFGRNVDAEGLAVSNDPADTSSVMAVLEAVPNPDPTITKTTDINFEDDALVPETGPAGTAADLENAPSSDEISLYVVRKGDSIASIAKMFDVSTNTILWANNLKKGQALTEGQTITILPVTGVSHKIAKGDTVSSIAKKYGGDAQDIAFFNGIAIEDPLTPGDTIIIPDGEVATPVVVAAKPSKHYTINPVTHKRELIKGTGGPKLSGYFMKPIPCEKSQGLHGHNGIDLSCHVEGTPIRAAASGTVIVASSGGWGGGYGSYVVVRHPNGTQTLYAHMSRVEASVGQQVSQGDEIGRVGSTGKSTGPHLHFEVRGAKNPGLDGSWAK